ncbi:MAG: hypothetical protein M0P57_06765 [Syntrophales bacterium]|jgi:hypothetical protein|nr:hypothetical protein [Syntrophales bacterium]MDY0043620.1 hypothetical protein [Syntrophales bacterium]
MKKILLAAIMALLLWAVPAFAVTPITPGDTELVMYADDFTAGGFVPVSMSPYNGYTHAQRLCPQNALGPFDAVPGTGFNEKFFGVASRAWTHYTFEDQFMNVDGAPDIEFAEVTWGSGNSWHVEAVKVYLTGAIVRNEEGELVEYGTVDDGIGYYAGIAWNRTGIQYVSEARRIELAESYGPADRDYDSNEFYFSGTFGWTQFNLPAGVVCAEGIYLVDITSEVYAEGGAGGTYTSGTGALVTAVICPIGNAEDVTIVPGTGNTDGYDLDAIRVYRCILGGDDTATGMGTAILENGTWFMYNYVSGCSPQIFNIQAGNPKNELNIIGTFTVACSGIAPDCQFTITYDIDDSIIKNGYEYNIVVVDEHLAISDQPNFTAVPGQDDNRDFGVPFEDSDCNFYVFAHFAVEYR